MRELLIATRNRGKIPEMEHGLQGLPFQILVLDDTAIEKEYEPEETGKTFAENARIKAESYAKRTGLLTVADDSGIAVSALGGQPGVLSARYAPGTDDDRNKKLLAELMHSKSNDRAARYVAALCVFDPLTGESDCVEGVCEGEITQAPSGTAGFGYDPIFMSRELKKTFGEATSEEKASVSHRGRAITQLRSVMTRFV